ncbi:MAG: hypothetical protein DRI48_04890, partial [Chloroflexi bacterium]
RYGILYNILNGARQNRIATKAYPRAIPRGKIVLSACLTDRLTLRRAPKRFYNSATNFTN